MGMGRVLDASVVRVCMVMDELASCTREGILLKSLSVISMDDKPRRFETTNI